LSGERRLAGDLDDCAQHDGRLRRGRNTKNKPQRHREHRARQREGFSLCPLCLSGRLLFYHFHMSNVRVGIAGSGFAARFHYAALRKVYGVNVEVAGVWSPKPENRRKFAAERGIAEFASLEALSDACDVVSACA